MNISKLLGKNLAANVQGNPDTEIQHLSFDSRDIQAGTLFFAISGTQRDGHEFISQVIEAGAVAIVCEKLPENRHPEVTYIQVKNSQAALSTIAAAFYGNPAEKLQVIGVTGTNGKTSISTLLYNIFNELGHKSGLISTISYKIGKTEIPASHTTPDPIRLQQAFAEMLAQDCEYCFMEVSSHALVQNRVAGIPFRLAMFSNISHDHLDYHGTFAHYIKAKKILFDNLDKNAVAIINSDDRNGAVMVQNCKAKIRTYALNKTADYHCRLLENTFEGLFLAINGTQSWFRLVGSFNAYNLTCVYAAAVELGMDAQEVLRVLSAQGGVNGRFEAIHSPEKKVTAIVDYAHTPDALENVLHTIKDINQGQNKVITVVGCGGNRDKEKRPVMAKIACEFSDTVILTSDNPRYEKAADILAEMNAGVPVSARKKVSQIENRAEAIGIAIRLASPGDIILVAGKGHETYQEIEGVKYPFDDKAVIREKFEVLG